LACALLPEIVLAHEFIPGAGSFINGLVHPYVIVQHIIAMLILGMFIGQHEWLALKWSLPVFLVTVFAGLYISTFWLWPPIQLVILVVCMLLGLAVAIARPLPLVGLALVVACIGVMIGLDSPQLELFGFERWKAFLGTAIGTIIALLLMAAITRVLDKPWQQIGIRILGSWGAASALMVLALVVTYWR
jgi:urease accessory protein